jgi:hypothetical protein
MNIGGKKRETVQFDNAEFTKKVGLFEARVVAINPTVEEFKDVLNMELKEDSKQAEYLSTSKDGNAMLRLDFWLEEIKNKDKFRLTFFLENKERENKDQTKKQYINNVGLCSWADDINNLADWFAKDRSVRVAFLGEEDLYNFLRTWLGNLDLRDAESTLELDWSKLMKGNIKDLKSLIDGEWVTNVVALATIRTVEKEDGVKEYQGVYNRAFLAPYNIKHFRLIDFTSESVLKAVYNKKAKELKPYEKFVKDVTGEYGCKDFYIFKDLRDYNREENLVSSNDVIAEDDGSY